MERLRVMEEQLRLMALAQLQLQLEIVVLQMYELLLQEVCLLPNMLLQRRCLGFSQQAASR
jgi:hypothetical protein